MSKTKIVFLSVLAGLAIMAFTAFSWVTGTYNSFVEQRETVNTSWSQVETQYQRRFDLIPNLTNATRGYLAHEQKVFKDIADARSRYAGTAPGSEERVGATSQLEGVLARLLVIIESYPTLQANQTVAGLMDELAGTENRVNVARQRYNEQVQTYNVMTMRFPGNLIAGVFNFEEKPFFEAIEVAEEAPTVNLEIKEEI